MTQENSETQERRRTEGSLERVVRGRAYGYLCPMCGEQLYDIEATEHAEDGLAHAACLTWHHEG